MYVDFETLSPNSKVWIYQSNKKFTADEVVEIKIAVHHFAEQWHAHGTSVNASFKILLDQFLVLSVDENGPDASGCSIDSSVHFIKGLEKKHGVSLLDKSAMAFQSNDEIQVLPFNQVKAAITEGKLRKDAYYFNNSITKKKDLEKDWKQNLENSWVAKYF